MEPSEVTHTYNPSTHNPSTLEAKARGSWIRPPWATKCELISNEQELNSRDGKRKDYFWWIILEVIIITVRAEKALSLSEHRYIHFLCFKAYNTN